MRRKSSKQNWQRYWFSEDHQPQVIHKELLKNLLSVIKIKNKSVLEIGAGMGGDSLYLAKKGAQITVLDFSQKALDLMRINAEKSNVKIKTVLADATTLPFKSEFFEVIFHQGFLEHFQNPIPLIGEQRRVLKNGGILVIDVPQKFTTYTIKKHLKIWQKKWFAGWETEYSISGLENLIRKCGFKILKSYGWGYYGKLYWWRNLKLGDWYEKVWGKIETTRIKLYLNWCIGVVAKKE